MKFKTQIVGINIMTKERFTFLSLSEATHKTKIHFHKISECIRGKFKSVDNFRFYNEPLPLTEYQTFKDI
jgi:hypothetical protein